MTREPGRAGLGARGYALPVRPSELPVHGGPTSHTGDCDELSWHLPCDVTTMKSAFAPIACLLFSVVVACSGADATDGSGQHAVDPTVPPDGSHPDPVEGGVGDGGTTD